MEQLRMSAGKDNERVVQILTDLMKTNKEFQIMITVPASGASSLSEMAKEEETAVKPAALSLQSRFAQSHWLCFLSVQGAYPLETKPC